MHVLLWSDARTSLLPTSFFAIAENNPMVLPNTPRNRLFQSIPQTAIAVLGMVIALHQANVLAGKWKGTVGEPLVNSSSHQIDLARHLNKIGAVFYGSWTCPACFRQMNVFGKQAGEKLTYVECGKPKKLPKQHQACLRAEIRAYPTWVLSDGSRREGIQSIAELSSWTEFSKRLAPYP